MRLWSFDSFFFFRIKTLFNQKWDAFIEICKDRGGGGASKEVFCLLLKLRNGYIFDLQHSCSLPKTLNYHF